MENLHKTIKILWDKNHINFDRCAFVEGDLNIGELELEIKGYVCESQLEVTFYNENEGKLYTKKVNLFEKNTIKIPNEVLQIAGKVLIRLTQEKNESILQATEEIYFYVEKKSYEYLRKYIPELVAKDVKNTIDELYLLLDNGRKELNLYVEIAKQNIKDNSITSLQIHQLIEQAKK